MKKITLLISALVAICVISPAVNVKKLISARAALDSAYILMGNKTALHLEVVGDLDGTGHFQPKDSLWNTVEISYDSDSEVIDLGNNRKQLKKDFIIQSFDSGLYNLPTIEYIQGNETITANKVTLKVIPVNIDTLTTIHDYDGVISPGKNFFDFVPDWLSDYGFWILLVALVCAIAILLYTKYLRKGKVPLLPKKKIISPYELAMDSLQRLEAKKLCEKGEERAFYTELTEILRQYLHRRFGINAMEMTSSQIMTEVRKNNEARLSENIMARILETADFVKFAKVRPLPSDNIEAFEQAVRFVEDTKPVPINNEIDNPGHEK